MQAMSNPWYILIKNQKHGPFSYKDMIEMIQSNQLMNYTHVWSPHLEQWTALHLLEDFSQDRMRLLIQNHDELKTAFIQRQGPRVYKNIPVLGHNGSFFFDGMIQSISEKGALCLINSPLVSVKDKIKLIIKNNENFGRSFNLEALVIRKNQSQQRLNSKSGLFYIIKFEDVQAAGTELIQSWLTKAS